MADPGSVAARLIEQGVPPAMAARRAQAEVERSRNVSQEDAQRFASQAGAAASLGDVPLDVLRAASIGSDNPREISRVFDRVSDTAWAEGVPYESPYDMNAFQRIVGEQFIPGAGGVATVAGLGRLAAKTPRVLQTGVNAWTDAGSAVRNALRARRGEPNKIPMRGTRHRQPRDWDPAPVGPFDDSHRLFGGMEPDPSDARVSDEVQQSFEMIADEGQFVDPNAPGPTQDALQRLRQEQAMEARFNPDTQRAVGESIRGQAGEFFGTLRRAADQRMMDAADPDQMHAWDEVMRFLDETEEKLVSGKLSPERIMEDPARYVRANLKERGVPETALDDALEEIGERAGFDVTEPGAVWQPRDDLLRGPTAEGAQAIRGRKRLDDMLLEAPETVRGRQGRFLQGLDEERGLTHDVEQMEALENMGFGRRWMGSTQSQYGPVRLIVDEGTDTASAILPADGFTRRLVESGEGMSYLNETLGPMVRQADNHNMVLEVTPPGDLGLDESLRNFGFRKRPNLSVWRRRPPESNR